MHRSILGVALFLVALANVSAGPTTQSSKTHMTQDEALAAFKKLGAIAGKSFDELAVVCLGRTDLTNDDLALFEFTPDLTYVDISGNSKVTDVGIAHLAGLEKVHTLYARGTHITDASLPVFAKLAKLEELSLIDTDVSEAAARKFQDEHPKIKVSR